MFNRVVILVMLLVTPFVQAQAVVVCAVIDLKTAVRCCCPGDHRPSIKLRFTSIQCCAVDIQVGERQFVASTAESTNQLTVKGLFDHAPVTAITSSAPFFATAAIGILLSLMPFVSRFFLTIPTYLRTARLRL